MPNEGDLSNRTHIRTRHFLGLVAILSLTIAAYVIFYVQSLPLDFFNVRQTVEIAVFLFVWPALVVVPWRLVQRRRARYTNLPIWIASIPFLWVAYTVVRAALLLPSNYPG